MMLSINKTEEAHKFMFDCEYTKGMAYVLNPMVKIQLQFFKQLESNCLILHNNPGKYLTEAVWWTASHAVWT